LVAGVCGGLAEYFETDATIVRIIFILFSFTGAIGIILYLILWIAVPSEHPIPNHTSNQARENISHFVKELRSRLEQNRTNSRSVFGFFILLLGILLLLNNLFPDFGFEKFWPIFLIIFGAVIIFRKK